jgi:hypothetical protein
MPKISAGFLVGTALAAAILLAAPFAPASAGAVRGQIVVSAGDDVLRIASFSAESVDPEKGTAIGQINFHDPKATVNQDVDGTGDETLKDAPDGVKLEANVDCLFLDKGQAVVGGQVTSATVERYVGMWVLLYVADGAVDGERDKFSWGFYPVETETGCGSFPLAAYEPTDVDSGEIQVRE